MDNDQYSQVFKALNIQVQPLPANYTPDEFGRMLIAGAQTEHGVSYAASTDYRTPQKTPEITRDAH